MSEFCLLRPAVWSPEGELQEAFVHVREGRVARLEAYAGQVVPSGVPALDAAGLIVTPGWIDIQFNGAYGQDFTDDPEAIWAVAESLPRTGCAAFLPTIITAPLAVARHAMQVLRQGPPPGWKGALPLGLHLEGPFLNPDKRGAHNPLHIRLPDAAALQDWTRDNGVLLATLAPEIPGGLQAVRMLTAQGVAVSLGHSNADFDQAQAAFNAGARVVTHLYNAMPALGHRAPGLAGAALTHAQVFAGLIADGIHCHPAMLQLAWRMMGAQRVCLVTDAMAALGMPPGVYRLGDFDVTVDENSARLADGRLAGSVLTLEQALRNVMRWCDLSLAQALPALTSTPAAVLGLPEWGRVARGLPANLTLVDGQGRVQMTVAAGEMVFNRLSQA